MIVKRHELDGENVYLMQYCYEDTPEIPYHKQRPAVLVCPGGGYLMCSAREADPVAMQYAAAGYNTFVLYYTIGEKAAFPRPLLDLCAAMKLIRENAAEWGVISDNIAVCGFWAIPSSLPLGWRTPVSLTALSGTTNPKAPIGNSTCTRWYLPPRRTPFWRTRYATTPCLLRTASNSARR